MIIFMVMSCQYLSVEAFSLFPSFCYFLSWMLFRLMILLSPQLYNSFFCASEPFGRHGVSLVTSAEGADVTAARRVKTVNIQPGRKTVGHSSDRYRLRWIAGIRVFLVMANRGRGSRPPKTSFGTRRSGCDVHGPLLRKC